MPTYTVGQVLTAAEMNDLTSRPRCRVYRNGGLSAGAQSPFPFDTVSFDSASGWSASTHLYTVPEAGIWLVSCALGTTSSAAGQSLNVEILQNGSVVSKVDGTYSEVTGALLHWSLTDILSCSASDTIGAATAGNSNAYLNGSTTAFLSIVKIADL